MTDQDQPNTPQLYLITPVGAAASTVGPLLADVMDRFPVACLRIPGAGSEDDLGRLAAGMGGQGAAFLGMNPVHAGFPTEPTLFSPYTPSHRRRLNVIHLAAGEGQPGPLVDYLQDIPARMAMLRAEYDAFTCNAAFDTWLAAEGESLLLLLDAKASGTKAA